MKHPFSLTFLLVFFFFCAQLIGLAILHSYQDVIATQEQGTPIFKELPSIAGVPMDRPAQHDGSLIFFIAIGILIGTILIFFIMSLNKPILWKIWFSIALTSCLTFAFGAFLSNTLALLLAIGLSILKVFKPNMYTSNITELFLYGGLASIFVPLLSIPYAFLLLLLISLYDMYAVWKSKHMIALAKFQTNTGIFAGIYLPYKFGVPLSHTPSSKSKTIKTAILGGGDIGFPLIFSGTVLASKGFLPALLITVTCTLALFLLLTFGKKGRFYPAMPYLTLGCASGYLLSLLL